MQRLNSIESIDQISLMADFVLAQRLPRETHQGGIVVPDKEDPRWDGNAGATEFRRAIVRKVGPGEYSESGKRKQTELQPGDEILYRVAQDELIDDQQEIEVAGETLIFMREDRHVLAVIGS